MGPPYMGPSSGFPKSSGDAARCSCRGPKYLHAIYMTTKECISDYLCVYKYMCKYIALQEHENKPQLNSRMK